jgi:hypothetical protein
MTVNRLETPLLPNIHPPMPVTRLVVQFWRSLIRLTSQGVECSARVRRQAT